MMLRKRGKALSLTFLSFWQSSFIFPLILFKGTDSQSLYEMTIKWIPPRHEELVLIYIYKEKVLFLLNQRVKLRLRVIMKAFP